MLRKKDNFNLDERKKKAKKFIEELMVLTGEEKEYLDMFEKGEYMPSLLFSDNQILENIVHKNDKQANFTKAGFRHSAPVSGFVSGCYRAWEYRVFKVRFCVLEGIYAIPVP